MRAKVGWGLVWGALLVSFFAGHSRRAAAGNCALYARAITGVGLYGAAGGWWDEAAGRYQRGQVPAPGSILVFRETGIIPSGHVAVVAKVVGPSMVLVDQSNWYHGKVTLGTPVIDTSPGHDWTSVAVMDVASGQFGKDYPTYGFVYPQSGASELAAAVGTGGFNPAIAVERTAYEPGLEPGSFHFALSEKSRRRLLRGRGRAARAVHRKTAPRHAFRSAGAARPDERAHRERHAETRSHPSADHVAHTRAGAHRRSA